MNCSIKCTSRAETEPAPPDTLAGTGKRRSASQHIQVMRRWYTSFSTSGLKSSTISSTATATLSCSRVPTQAARIPACTNSNICFLRANVSLRYSFKGIHLISAVKCDPRSDSNTDLSRQQSTWEQSNGSRRALAAIFTSECSSKRSISLPGNPAQASRVSVIAAIIVGNSKCVRERCRESTPASIK